MNRLSAIRNALRECASAERAKNNARFFKTKPGEYGHGDRFIGVTVPAIRAVARVFKNTLLVPDSETLIISPIHEERLLGLLLLVELYKNADEKTQRRLFKMYLRLAKKHINNWDLVDLSARDIVGVYVREHEKERKILKKLARSKNLWERRIAIIATSAFIQKGVVSETFAVSQLLLGDTHDLIHKAVGWMLREAWKKDPARVEAFLATHKARMPRTALRYAIERMTREQKAFYMAQ
jgi:3-methyladenine DNA glycosylase AlkD